MGARPGRRAWTAFAAACVVATSVAWLAGAAAPSPMGGSPSGGPGRPSRSSALQMNLCDSGIAPCFSGRSVAVAAAVIRTERPTVVTLNEVCRDDVSVLRRAMAASRRGAHVVSAFAAAGDRLTHGAVRCLNGERYGIGVLVSVPSATSGYRTYRGVYPTQDLADPEERVWVCIHVPGTDYACTTHAADADASVAFVQCRYFLTSVVPALRRRHGDDPVVLGADLNLPVGDRPDPQACLPAGYQRADDGARQDIVTSPGIAVGPRTVIDMHGSTDHPGLLVQLDRPHSSAR